MKSFNDYLCNKGVKWMRTSEWDDHNLFSFKHIFANISEMLRDINFRFSLFLISIFLRVCPDKNRKNTQTSHVTYLELLFRFEAMHKSFVSSCNHSVKYKRATFAKRRRKTVQICIRSVPQTLRIEIIK